MDSLSVDHKYEEFILSYANKTLTTREIFKGGHSAGMRDALELLEEALDLMRVPEHHQDREWQERELALHARFKAIAQFKRAKGEL